MIFPEWSEQLTWEGGGTVQTVGTLTQKNVYKARVPRRANLRLESLVLVAIATNAAGAPVKNVDSLTGIVESAVLEVSDPQTRQAVNIDGASLIALQDVSSVPFDEFTNQARAISAGSFPGGAGAIGCTWFIPIRPPMLNEPAGMFLSIPMDRLAGDATFILNVRSTAEIFSANAPTALSFQVLAVYRDTQGAPVPEYIKSELNSRTYIPGVTGKTFIELNGEGYPFEVTMRCLSSGTYGNAITGVQPTVANSLITITRGRTVGPGFSWETWLKQTAYFRQANFATAAGAVSTNSPFYNVHFNYWSPIVSKMAVNPLSVNSVAPYRMGAIEEQKVRFNFDNWANAAYAMSVSQRLILGGPEVLELLNRVTV